MRFTRYLHACLISLMTWTAQAETSWGSIAEGMDHASIGIMHALKQIMLVLGVVLLVRSIQLFRRYAKAPLTVSFLGASWWGILGITLVLIYFFAH